MPKACSMWVMEQQVLPMNAPTLPIRLNRQLSGGKDPHLLEGQKKGQAQW